MTTNNTNNTNNTMIQAIAKIAVLIANINNDPAKGWTVDPTAAEAILDGRDVTIYVELSKPLQRWGRVLFLDICGGEIIANNLINNTWNDDPTNAEVEAAQAASYFLDSNNNLNDAVIIRIIAE